MTDSKYLQEGFEKQLSHVIEECGEFLAAAGKLQRWGAHSRNLLLPEGEYETNLDWMKRELEDLLFVGTRLKETLKSTKEVICYKGHITATDNKVGEKCDIPNCKSTTQAFIG